MRDDPRDPAITLPSWVVEWPSWATHAYLHGFYLTYLGATRNLPWLEDVGKMMILMGGLILNGLYAVALANYRHTPPSPVPQ